MIDALPLLLSAVLAAEPPTEQTDRVFESHCYGTIYVVTVSEKDVAGTPEWRDDQPNPPWSARKAMKLASETAPKFPGFPWHVASVSLEEFSGRWFWLVKLKTRQTDRYLSQELQWVVLMDGTIIEPEVRQQPPVPGPVPSA
jgi:hypothetical protein